MTSSLFIIILSFEGLETKYLSPRTLKKPKVLSTSLRFRQKRLEISYTLVGCLISQV